jgi:hypothetical protein
MFYKVFGNWKIFLSTWEEINIRIKVLRACEPSSYQKSFLGHPLNDFLNLVVLEQYVYIIGRHPGLAEVLQQPFDLIQGNFQVLAEATGLNLPVLHPPIYGHPADPKEIRDF